MCGFVSIYHSRAVEAGNDTLRVMTESLVHRGPDDYGYAFSGEASRRTSLEPPGVCRGPGVSFGHRRLSIIDTSTAGRQPFISRDGRFWLVYNGEIFNYVELREELRRAGHDFTTETDSEVFLHAFEEWGRQCVTRFNGMWAAVVWDAREKVLCASRDRFGIKPLFWQAIGSELVFASEVKALLRHPGSVCRPLPEKILYNLFDTGWPLGEETFFENVRQVEPGTNLVVSRDGISSERYWELPEQAPSMSTAVEELADELRGLFDDAVRLRLRSDVPVATMLSAGLDSTSVVSTAKRHLDRWRELESVLGARIRAFSALFPGEAIDEQRGIEEFREGLGLEVENVFPLGVSNVDELVRDCLYYLEGPFFSSVFVVNAVLMGTARRGGYKVVLDGHGADEIFAGYPDPYCYLRACDRLSRFELLGAFRETASLAVRHALGWQRSIRGVLAPFRRDCEPQPGPKWVEGSRLADPSLQRERERRCQAFTEQKGASRLDKQLRWDLTQSILPQWLHLEDRMSMRSSVEARVPFLDYRIVSFAFSLPDRLKIHRGVTKYVARKAMADRLPTSIVESVRKQPFRGADGSWLRGSLRSDLEHVLGGSRTRLEGMLDAKYIKDATNRFLAGDNSRTRFVWTAYNTELWLRRFFG